VFEEIRVRPAQKTSVRLAPTGRPQRGASTRVSLSDALHTPPAPPALLDPPPFRQHRVAGRWKKNRSPSASPADQSHHGVSAMRLELIIAVRCRNFAEIRTWEV
jgi:hypothetical protein